MCSFLCVKMAAGVQELQDDFLTCPLCLQLYTQPKLLPCQHTFCLLCLQKYIIHNRFPLSQCICPICRVSAEVPNGEAANLQNNILIIGLLDLVRDKGENAERLETLPSELPGNQCPLCEEMCSCADFCLQCSCWMCTVCKRSHSKVPATKNHSMRTLKDFQAKGVEELRKVKDIMHGFLEKIEAHEAMIFHQRQVLAEQMAEATHTINIRASQLKSLIEDMEEKSLSQLYAKIFTEDDSLSKALVKMEWYRKQLDIMNDKLKASHSQSSTDLGLNLRFAKSLHQDLHQLSSLPAPTADVPLVKFYPAPLLLPSLAADTFGQLATFDEVASSEKRYFPAGEAYQFTPLVTVNHLPCHGFVTSILAFGAASEKLIYVIGNHSVCCYPPRYKFSIPDFSFSEQPIFQKPWSIALTPDKKVLVTDAGSNTGEGFVAVCDRNGNFMKYLAKGLSLPRGITVGSDGLVYVCDQDDRCIYILDYSRNGSLQRIVKKDPAGKFIFQSPMNIAIANNGDILVTDAGHFVKIFSSSFILKKTYQSPLPHSEFWGVCTDHQGQVYVTDWKYGIHILSDTSDAKFKGLLKGLKSANIVEPSAVTLNWDTKAFFVGSSNLQIHKCTVV